MRDDTLFRVAQVDNEIARDMGWDSVEQLYEDAGISYTEYPDAVWDAGITKPINEFTEFKRIDHVIFIGIVHGRAFPHDHVPVIVDEDDNLWMTGGEYERYNS